MPRQTKDCKKSKTHPEYSLNVWNKQDFTLCIRGETFKILGIIKYTGRHIKWSAQRVTRGYSDFDLWNMYNHLQKLLPAMLQRLKDTRIGSPGELGEEYIDEERILVNDTCHAEWDKILDQMIVLWRESDEDTCSKKNPYDEEYSKALDEFERKYGACGEGLLTDEEKEEGKKKGATRMHMMDELPEYKDISERYMAEDAKLAEYRNSCKDQAMDLLKKL